jgi:hypothetical protein
VNRVDSIEQQLNMTNAFFEQQITREEMAA